MPEKSSRKFKVGSLLNWTVAIVGCVTGVASFGWQIYSHFGKPVEKFTAEFVPALAMSSLNPEEIRNQARIYRMKIYITNDGKNTIFVPPLIPMQWQPIGELVRFGQHFGPSGPAFALREASLSENPPQEIGMIQIPPGETKAYTAGPMSIAEVESILEEIPEGKDLYGEVRTSRGTTRRVKDLDGKFREWLQRIQEDVEILREKGIPPPEN